MKKIYLTILAVIATLATMHAAAPAGYYSAANGKQGNAIRLALQTAIDNHNVVSYDNLYTLYRASDSKPDGTVWDMYSTCTWQHGSKKCGSYSSVCDCYNREHSIPQSWFNKAMPMKSDAFHVLPTDGKVNNQRSVNPFGECSSGNSLGDKALGRSGSSTFSGYSGTVFEPDDEYKGDFARTYFYMATRYAGKCESWGHNVFSSANSGLSNYAVALFLKWHRQDPVSEKERVRNDAIYSNNTGYSQGNRNPFIDYPCLVEYIWGNRKTMTLDLDQIMSAYDAGYDESDLTGCSVVEDQPELQEPYNGQNITIAGANINQTSTTTLRIKGAKFAASASITITGANASLFTISTATLTPAQINAGTDIIISYTPTAVGNHSATLTISSADLTGNITVGIAASCQTALIYPTDTELYFSQDNVGQTTTADILFQATNITQPVTITLSGANASSFALTDNSSTLSTQNSSITLSAADAIAGHTYQVSYTPTAIGTARATLTAQSGEIGTRTIALTGTTSFVALPATDITTSSFVAHWSYAGNVDYTLDIFTMQLSETVQQTVIDADITTLADATGTGHLTIHGNTYNDNGGLRLGTSKGDGYIRVVNTDFSQGGTITITAKQFGTDNSTLDVKYGSVSVGSQTLTNTFADYTITIPATTNEVSINQGTSGERVIISHITIVAGAESQPVRTSIEGYPVTLTNTDRHSVIGLEDSTDYFYTVTLANGNTTDPWQVRTGHGNVSADENIDSRQNLVYYTDASHSLHIENLTPDCTVSIYTPSGILVLQRTKCRNTETFTLDRGIYIITTSTGQFIKAAL